MKNYKKFISILLFTFIFQGTLSADIPHFLDFKYILNNSDAGSKAQKELKAKLDNGISNLKKKEKKLQDDEKKIIQEFL